MAASFLAPLSDRQRDRLTTAHGRRRAGPVDRVPRRGEPRSTRATRTPGTASTPTRPSSIPASTPVSNVDRSRPIDDDEVRRPPGGAFLVATLHGDPVGCGGVKLHRDRPAEIKRLWVDDSARGLGLGRRLLSDLKALAASAGHDAVQLDTNRTLTEAIALYRSSGYPGRSPPSTTSPTPTTGSRSGSDVRCRWRLVRPRREGAE